MKDENYWSAIKEANNGRRADWVGHRYIQERRCICGTTDCVLQGKCHCGCGAQTDCAKVSQHRTNPPYSISGLPSKWLYEHRHKGAVRKGVVHSKIKRELAILEDSNRCVCGASNCRYRLLCHCGCGSTPPLATATKTDGSGRRASFAHMPIRYLPGHQPQYATGRNSPLFKGELVKWGEYWYRYAPDHPRAQKGRIQEHIWIIEQEIGRHLLYFGKNHKDNEVVHHIDLDGSNNDRNNLELMTHGEHSRLHRELENRPRKIIRRRISVAHRA